MESVAVAILAAMEEEIGALRTRLRAARRMRVGRSDLVFGRLEGVPVLVARTGDGAENAARGAAVLFDRFPVRGAVVVGISGGLSPALEPGTLLAARDIIEDGRAAPPPDAVWLGRLLRDTGATPATFVSSRDLLCTARAKQEAYASLPQGSVASVDIESAAFARAAAGRGIPYVALRAVSDPAEESLPLDFNGLRVGSGGIDRRRVALRALRRPGLVVPLWRLRRRASLCSEALRRAVSTLLAGGVP